MKLQSCQQDNLGHVWIRGTETEVEGVRVGLMDIAVTARPSIKENDAAEFWPTLRPGLDSEGLKGSWDLNPTRGTIC